MTARAGEAILSLPGSPSRPGQPGQPRPKFFLTVFAVKNPLMFNFARFIARKAQNMYRNVNNDDATRHAVNRVPFINSTKSRSGRWDDEAGIYEVRSYATVVATYRRDTGQWWVTTDRYSTTTSRQVNALARSLDLVHPSPVLRCSSEDLVTA